jgi:glycerol dehydrogenase-like iron-containing ADH family enzyme
MQYPKLIVSAKDIKPILDEMADGQTLLIIDRYIYDGLPDTDMVIQATEQKAEHIQHVRESLTFTKVIAIGGCTALDFGRACAVGGKDLIVIPTLLSNSCLSTNRSVINYGGKYRTEITTAPKETVISLPAIKKRHASGEDNLWTASGFGDLFSALSASIEFEYIRNDSSFTGWEASAVIANIPMCWEALQWVLQLRPPQDLNSYQIFRKLSLYLHESSLDVIRYGHTKLNAASEHKLYYMLQEEQQYDKGHATHGMLVAIGTLITTKIFEQETGNAAFYSTMRAAHRRLGLPVSYADLQKKGVLRSHIVKGLDAVMAQTECLYTDYFRGNGYALLDQIFKDEKI